MASDGITDMLSNINRLTAVINGVAITLSRLSPFGEHRPALGAFYPRNSNGIHGAGSVGPERQDPYMWRKDGAIDVPALEEEGAPK
jgi:hypothetical protein